MYSYSISYTHKLKVITVYSITLVWGGIECEHESLSFCTALKLHMRAVPWIVLRIAYDSFLTLTESHIDSLAGFKKILLVITHAIVLLLLDWRNIKTFQHTNS